MIVAGANAAVVLELASRVTLVLEGTPMNAVTFTQLVFVPALASSNSCARAHCGVLAA